MAYHACSSIHPIVVRPNSDHSLPTKTFGRHSQFIERLPAYTSVQSGCSSASTAPSSFSSFFSNTFSYKWSASHCAFASWALTKVGRPSVETVLKEINPRCSISFHFLDLKPAWPVQKRHSSAVVLTQWPHWVCSTTTYHRNVTILACKMVPGTVLVLRSCKVFIQSSAAGCSVTITFKSP